MQIKRGANRGAAKYAASADWDFTRVEIHGMVCQNADGRAALDARSRADGQALEHAAIKGVAEERIDYVVAVSVQRAYLELITQHVEQARREVEQRADARIGLAVIVAESTFVVSAQISQAVVEAHQPVSAE